MEIDTENHQDAKEFKEVCLELGLKRSTKTPYYLRFHEGDPNDAYRFIQIELKQYYDCSQFYLKWWIGAGYLSPRSPQAFGKIKYDAHSLRRLIHRLRWAVRRGKVNLLNPLAEITQIKKLPQ